MTTKSPTPVSLDATLAGRYVIERELGRGGMATVYLARDLQRDEQRVAVKVLLPELAASIGADRFLREIELGKLLQHPHIVGVLDSGEVGGQLYYVMPYVNGESLRDRLDRERQLAIETTIDYTRQIADALDFAHARDVVHRDIKPENILIEGDKVWVADFGIARAVTVAGGEKLTRTGMAVGTPVYMSPEQALGGRDATAQSDIYSLGCVVFEMLAGDPPFTGGNMMALLAKHSMEAVPSLRIVRQSVPESVEAAVFCALEKTPADRFRTAGDFARALAGEITVTPRQRTSTFTTAYTTQTPVPAVRSRRPMVLAVAATALLLVGGGLAAWRLRGPRPGAAALAKDSHIAVLYFADDSPKGELASLADGLTESLIGALSRVPTLQVVSRNGVAPFRRTTAFDSVARALDVGTIVVGSVRPQGTGVHVDVRLIDAESNTDLKRQGFDVGAAALATLSDSLTTRVAEFLRKEVGLKIQLGEQRSGTADAQAWLWLQRGERRRKDADSLAAAGDVPGALRALDGADSALAVAAASDGAWAEPVVLRAVIAAQRARTLREKPAEALAAAEAGLPIAEKAVELDPQSADALEARGTLHFQRYQQLVSTNEAAAERDLAQAEQDLRAATQANPAKASAYAQLSVLYYRKQSVQEAYVAARAAYQADAYLASADQVLTRLFWTSHDMESFTDAQKWCSEGYRRFPTKPFFTECRLWLLTTKLDAPDARRAWQLYDSLKAVTPPAKLAMDSLKGRIIVAMVLARDPRLADSARRVIKTTEPPIQVDPRHSLAGLRAVPYVFLHDYDAAIDQLQTYLVANPEHARGFKTNTGLWWRDPGLQGHPRFQRLLAGIH